MMPHVSIRALGPLFLIKLCNLRRGHTLKVCIPVVQGTQNRIIACLSCKDGSVLRGPLYSLVSQGCDSGDLDYGLHPEIERGG